MTKVLLVVFTLSLSLQALACKCYPRYESKTYQEIKETWHGKVVSYSCNYECRGNNRTDIITGFHKKRLFGKEKGHEIVCDGTVYREQYSNHRGWFIWVYEKSEWFDPRDGNSKTLKAWADANNCR